MLYLSTTAFLLSPSLSPLTFTLFMVLFLQQLNKLESQLLAATERLSAIQVELEQKKELLSRATQREKELTALLSETEVCTDTRTQALFIPWNMQSHTHKHTCERTLDFLELIYIYIYIYIYII